MKNNRTKCEIYSRVVGYIRPTVQWNDGKQAEFKDRKTYNIDLLTDEKIDKISRIDTIIK